MKEPKTLRTGFREKLAKFKHGLRSTDRDRHKADDSSSKVPNETLQTNQIATNGASHVDGADTERVNIEGPAAACSQLEQNTSEQPPQLAASDKIPLADDAQASMDAIAQHALTSPVVSLWDEAYKILISEHPKLAMDAFEDELLHSGSTDSSPDHAVTINRPHAEKEKLIQEMAQEKLERLSQNRLRLSIGNKEYEVRDQLKKTFQFVIHFKDLISFAVSHEPSAALAWSGVIVALQLLNTGLKQDEDAASGLEYVTDVMLRCRMFQNELQDIDLLDKENEQHTALMKSLRDSTIELYTKVLQYHIEIIRHYNGQAVKRSFKDFVGVPQWKEQKQEIVRIDDEITRKQRQLNYHVVQKMEEEFRKFDAENTKQHEKTQQRVDAGIEDAHIRRLDPYFKHDATFVLEETVKGRKPGCLHGTRTTILKSIRDWILDDQGPTIYWLQAMSGTGKSTVARTVAAALSTDTLTKLGVKSDEAAPVRFKHLECSLAASFFFSQGDESRNTTRYVFLTILRCFTLQPTYGQKIRKFVAEACADMDNIMSKGYTGLWDEFISKQLPKFVDATMKTPERWVVIIDALDECQVDKHEIVALLGQLAQCNQLRNDHLQIRFLVTSRPVTHVTEAFRKVDESQYRSERLERVNVMGLNQSILPDNDIVIFLRDELGRIAEERTLAPQGKEWPGEDAINRLAMKSQGLFIYAATCSRFLDNDLAEEQLDGILNDTTEKGSPQDLLFEMYGKIMEVSGGKSGITKMQALKDILGPLIVLTEPVSINVLALLLPRQDLDYVEARLRGLHSVIDVPKDANAPVKIHHLSFHDFLVDPQTNETHNWLWIDEIKTHTRMLERCLDILEECLQHRDICEVRLPELKVDELSQDSIQQYIKPHVQYACRYWVHHLSKSNAASAPEVADKVYDFLKTRFLFWVEAMAWMKEISATITMVVQLREIFKPGSQVGDFAKDAWRFLLTNRSGVECAPLQLYCSALLFSPLKSEIRKLYGDEHIPSWITRHPQVAEHWSPQLFVLEGPRFSSIKISADSTIISAIQGGSSVFLWNLITGALISILKPKDRRRWLYSIALSPDARMLACVHGNRLERFENGQGITMWEVASGDVIFADDHFDAVQVGFSPDAKTVFSVCGRGTVKSWNVAQGQTCKVPQSRIPWKGPWISFKPTHEISWGGQKVAICLDSPNSIVILDMQTGDTARELRFTPKQIAWSSNDSLLAAIGHIWSWEKNDNNEANNVLEVWLVSTWKTKIRVEFPELLEYVAISPDNSLVALGGRDIDKKNVIMLISASDGGKLWTSSVSVAINWCLSFSPDGQYLVSAITQEGIAIWDVETCKLAGDGSCIDAQNGNTRGHDLNRSRHYTDALSINPGGRSIHSMGEPVSELFHLVTGAPIAQDVTFANATFSPNGRIACLFNTDWWERERSDIRVWDMLEDREFRLEVGLYTTIEDCSLSDGSLVLALQSESDGQECTQEVRVVSLDDMRTLHYLPVTHGGLDRVFHLGTADLVAYTTSDERTEKRTLNVWHVKKGAIVYQVRYNAWEWEDFPEDAFSPDGQFFIHSSGPRNWQLREVLTGAVRFEKSLVLGDTSEWGRRHTSAPSPAFSADGRFLAVPELYDYDRYMVSHRYMVRIWQIPSGDQLIQVGPREGLLFSVALSARDDTRALIVVSREFSYRAETTIGVWDLASGGCWSADNNACFLRSKTRFKTRKDIISENCCHIISRLGSIPLPDSIQIRPGNMLAQVDHHAHLWYEANSHWLMLEWQQLLWLPPAYRPRAAAVHGSTVALAGEEKSIIVVGFNIAEMPTMPMRQGGASADDEDDCGIWKVLHDDKKIESDNSSS